MEAARADPLKMEMGEGRLAFDSLLTLPSHLVPGLSERTAPERR